MKKSAFVLLLCLSIPTLAMTAFPDGSITLTKEEVANMDKTLEIIGLEIQKQEEVIEKQKREIESLKKLGACI